jgi:hypothetical protein
MADEAIKVELVGGGRLDGEEVVVERYHSYIMVPHPDFPSLWRPVADDTPIEQTPIKVAVFRVRGHERPYKADFVRYE